MGKWLYDISADGGKTYTTQWLTACEAEEEKAKGRAVVRRKNLFILSETLCEGLKF